jgi:hypothetical protein
MELVLRQHSLLPGGKTMTARSSTFLALQRMSAFSAVAALIILLPMLAGR